MIICKWICKDFFACNACVQPSNKHDSKTDVVTLTRKIAELCVLKDEIKQVNIRRNQNRKYQSPIKVRCQIHLDPRLPIKVRCRIHPDPRLRMLPLAKMPLLLPVPQPRAPTPPRMTAMPLPINLFSNLAKLTSEKMLFLSSPWLLFCLPSFFLEPRSDFQEFQIVSLTENIHLLLFVNAYLCFLFIQLFTYVTLFRFSC